MVIYELYRFVESGIFCYKQCPSSIRINAVECYRNSTNAISYHHLVVPPAPDVVDPIPLFTLDTNSDVFYPVVKFEIKRGNERRLFAFQQQGLYRASLLLVQPVIGEEEFELVLHMEVKNLNRVTIASQLAVVKVYIEKFAAKPVE